MSIPKRVRLFYFSGTGNTWWVTRRLVEVLKENGHLAEGYSIENLRTQDAKDLIRDSDVVGFGYPVYGSDLPGTMKEFMASLPPISKDTFLYCTQWLWSGDGARVGTEFLHRSYKAKWAEHFFMPNNASVSILRLPYTNDRNKIESILQRAEWRIRSIAGRINAGKPFLRGFNRVAVFSGFIQRGPYRRMYAHLRDDISVDSKRCTLCGQCVRLCPAENLYQSEDLVRTRGKCILCLRCHNYCPEMAIAYMGKVPRKSLGVPYRGPVEGFDPAALRSGGESSVIR